MTLERGGVPERPKGDPVLQRGGWMPGSTSCPSGGSNPPLSATIANKPRTYARAPKRPHRLTPPPTNIPNDMRWKGSRHYVSDDERQTLRQAVRERGATHYADLVGCTPSTITRLAGGDSSATSKSLWARLCEAVDGLSYEEEPTSKRRALDILAVDMTEEQRQTHESLLKTWGVLD